MSKPVRKKRTPPKDVNQWAQYLVEQSTAEPETPVPAGLSAYMSAIGRKGGAIGGKRRMASMLDADKGALGLKAATARWNKERAKKKRGGK